MKNLFHQEIEIPVDKTRLSGTLFIPPEVNGLVIFSHGSGSSRYSKRNQQVASFLHQRRYGTLLFDLLTPQEDSAYYNRFNIQLLSRRLAGATEWLAKHPVAKGLRIGYFGASTGAASALQAAAELTQVGAVVSRGGRPDLAPEDTLKHVKAPVLLIIGSLDTVVLQLNRQAFNELRCPKELAIVDGATHLFEEPGKLNEVAKLALAWFEKYLKPAVMPKIY
ncbi:dienelactone hydrolase family protein [Niabella sp. CC-SYL272]|uniref:dienelactone hydrolase family protein n=1 Tax=Niabella agricola TaxID=2891571 RepID=UPI001F45F0F9|nr:dienelactone hydrolase family protein [Niabella agricola]MCF3107674.1 dienelactone hydrolase family protein [Niabella agricola]